MDPSHCYRVGPLPNKIVAASLSDTFSSQDRSNVLLFDLEFNEKTAYRVFITFQQDQGNPFDIERYLNEKGVEDFYRFSAKEGEVRVSVGFFGSELNAIAYQKSLVERGLEAEYSEVQKKSLWANLSLDGSQTSLLELELRAKEFAPAASVKSTQCSR